MPITWRNIQGGNGAVAAGHLLNSAQNSINTGLDKITDVFAQYRETDRANWENGKENNTQAFLDRLAQYKTPEELAAAQASGELDALKQQFGAQIDRGLVRDTEAGMQQKLIERITAQNQFADDTRMRNERGIRDELQGRLYAGDIKGFTAGLAQHELLNEAELAKEGYDVRLALRGEQREDTRLGFEGARVQLARNADARSGEAHRLDMDRKLQEKAIGGLVSQALDGAESHEEARQRLLSWGKDQGLPADALGTALSQLGATYTASTGILPEQEAEAEKATLPFEMAAQTAEKLAAGKTVFSFPEPEKVTVQDAIKEGIAKGSKDEQVYNSDQIQKALNEFKKNREVKIPDSVNLGPVLKQALQTVGVQEGLFEIDGRLNTSKLKDAMESVYTDMLRLQGLQDDATLKRATANAEKAKLLGTYKARNSLTNIQ